MIIFVGDKPGKANIDPKIPFVGTKSYTKLLSWIDDMNIDISQVYLCNKDSEDLSFWYHQYRQKKRCIRFVCLGEASDKKLKLDGIDIRFKLPHPSGLNRKLNDKEWVVEQLKLCKEWLDEQELLYN